MFFISTLALFLNFPIRFPLFGQSYSNSNGCLEPVQILFDDGADGPPYSRKEDQQSADQQMKSVQEAMRFHQMIGETV